MNFLAEVAAAKRARARARFGDMTSGRRDTTSHVAGTGPADTTGAAGGLLRFTAALREGSGIIAEIKRRSPSRGDLDRNLDPARLARAYQAGGASAVSVLTEEDHFAGSLADLRAARAAISLPILRKDFIVHREEIRESRLAGADAVLLIVAILGDDELHELLGAARGESLDALVEVHDEEELRRATAAGARLIGINHRDLRTLRMDPTLGERLLPFAPAGATIVLESGLRDPVVVRRLRTQGAHAFLIGESLVTSDDPEATLRDFAAALGGGHASEGRP